MDGSLVKFLGITKKTRDVFHLDWTVEPPNAVWLTSQPSTYSYSVEVKWKRQVTLCCIDQPTRIPFVPAVMVPSSVPLLKSMLQKSIRRQKTSLALKIAKVLINNNLTEFIRRIFIIMIEDVELHSSARVLIWLTSAITKGYVIDTNQVSWLLGIVEYLCGHPTKYYHGWATGDNQPPLDIPNYLKTLDSFNCSEKDMVYSLLFRHSYGGLHGDLRMIHYYITQLMNNHLIVDKTVIVPRNINTIDTLLLDDIIPDLVVCADFHCCPSILTVLNRRHPELTTSQVKQLIWDNLSKINTREPPLTCAQSNLIREINQLQQAYIIQMWSQ